MPNIKSILKKVRQLQPIPSVVHQVLAYSQDADSGVEELVQLVQHDPAITANLLKICNSAHMGLPVKVDSILKALIFAYEGYLKGAERMFISNREQIKHRFCNLRTIADHIKSDMRMNNCIYGQFED